MTSEWAPRYVKNWQGNTLVRVLDWNLGTSQFTGTVVETTSRSPYFVGETHILRKGEWSLCERVIL